MKRLYPAINTITSFSFLFGQYRYVPRGIVRIPGGGYIAVELDDETSEPICASIYSSKGVAVQHVELIKTDARVSI